MPVYFGLWKVNMSIPPPSPEEQIKQQEGFAALLNAQLQQGALKELHAFLETNSGYFITGDLPDEKHLETLAAWSPYVTFELHRTIPFPRAQDIFIGALKKRTGKT